MEWVIIIMAVAILQYLYFVARTGYLRGRYNVPAPKTTGNETWERVYRVQMNTLEQLVVFFPGLFAFAYLVSPDWVLIPGIAFVLGRAWYSYTYISNPSSRAPGMVVTLLSNAVLSIGSLIGAIMVLLQ